MRRDFSLIMRSALGLVVLVVSLARAGEDFDARALRRIQNPPLGLPPVPVPAENPPTPEKIALGRKLFFDRRLSVNNTMSCGMCHVPEQGFTSNELATPVGVEGRTVRRNSPTVINVAYVQQVFHDGRETSIETQPISPLTAHNEMANPSMGFVLARIVSLDDYDGRFERVFGGGPTVDRLGQALSAWQRTLVAANSPFDRWKFGGDENALTAEQKRGFALFNGKASCSTCHTVDREFALFTDDGFHDTGIGYFREEVAPADASPLPVEMAPGVVIPVERDYLDAISEKREPDLGRFEVTQKPEDKWRFRTPSLRNVAVTAPYMHDGSLRTLEDVVRFYARGGVTHPGLDPLLRPIDLSEHDVAALVAFLQGLTSPDLAELVADARSVAVGD
ncbi:MAG TPA: cytochrome c peroxidase [Candidatus Krumholzibacteria bacterium]|nr:cytochrome c peroxidase [Candidatus Krumholzibacteria bacterium]